MPYEGELILYQTEDGKTHIALKAIEGTVWLTQKEISSLFQKDIRTINEHIKNIFEEGECLPRATIRNFRIVQTEGGREVEREIDHYNLDVILAVGYRVKSSQGMHFRQWATTTLKDYLIKGFAINDERLKNTEGWDYFDELLERIREIRASEKRFYQKIRDVFSLSTDYDSHSQAAEMFFKTVQNKMLFAVTGRTAAELIVTRADAHKPNMGLTSFQGTRVRKGDVVTAKNYLQHEELAELNRIVTMFLDVAEDMARRRKLMYMQDWEKRLDDFLRFNERDVLTHAGRITAGEAEAIARHRYESFDAKRKENERLQAEEEYQQELKAIEAKAYIPPGKVSKE